MAPRKTENKEEEQENLRLHLQRQFAEDQVGRVPKKGGTYDYIEPRTAQDRLDEVLTPLGWSDSFRVVDPAKCAVECTISIYDSNTNCWVSKSDVGYPNNPVGATSKDGKQVGSDEPLKDAYSDAFKRAAVAWGIARYLYPTASKGQRYHEEVSDSLAKTLEFFKTADDDSKSRFKAYLVDKGHPLSQAADLKNVPSFVLESALTFVHG